MPGEARRGHLTAAAEAAKQGDSGSRSEVTLRYRPPLPPEFTWTGAPQKGKGAKAGAGSVKVWVPEKAPLPPLKGKVAMTTGKVVGKKVAMAAVPLQEDGSLERAARDARAEKAYKAEKAAARKGGTKKQPADKPAKPAKTD